MKTIPVTGFYPKVSMMLKLLLALSIAIPWFSFATETENRGLRVLPAPGAVVIDGKVNDWDLSGGIFACGELEHLRDNSSLWCHTMYDADNLYVLARWKDPTPMNNPEALGGHGFNGDCLQIRFIMFPGTKEQTASWWDGWRDNQGRLVLGRSCPGKTNGFPDNVMPNLEPLENGAKQAFMVDKDGKGYSQELAIPWKLLSISGRVPVTDESFKFTIEPNFTAGAFGRITIKDIFDEKSKTPDRVFTFRSFKDWGWATVVAKGKVDPQSVRLADGRTFPVSMREGVPSVDWTGLIKRFEWPGFKPITFDMPFTGYVSLNLVAEDGTVVRHLLNQDARTAGPVTIQWDGLTDATYRIPGQPVPVGNYKWKAIAHPGATLSLRGWAGFGGRAPWQATPEDFWLGDHGVPSAVVTDGTQMYLACNGAEGGRHLISTDFDGKLIWGLQNTTSASDPEIIAVDKGSVYVLHEKVSWMNSSIMMTRVDAKTGAYKQWTGRKTHILNVKDVFTDGKTDHLNGIDARDGMIYATTDDSLVIIDGDTGSLVKTFPLVKSGAIKVFDAEKAYVICEKDILAVNIKNGETKDVIKGLVNPQSITLDAKGRIFVSVGNPDNQVIIFNAKGKELKRVGENGGRQIGPWQSNRMLSPAGIAVDIQNKLWVMEHNAYPKRVSVWELGKTGIPTKTTFVKEFFGPTHYGASGAAINPRDPDLMVSEGCEWKLDPKTGLSVCLGTFDQSIHQFATYREGTNGKLYLITNKMRYGGGAMQIWERLGDANYKLRVEIDNDIKDADKKVGNTEIWTDLNDDGQKQPNELQNRVGALYCSGSNSWSLNLGPDLTFYGLDKSDGKLKALAIDGFTENGAPKYDFAKLKTLPDAMSNGYQTNYSCAVPSADNKTILINLSVKGNPAGFLWECFDLASGKLLWTYPNPYFQVHGSHLAPAPENGLFRGAYGPIGTANLPGVGNFWVINGNLGEWWALSSDGFYVTRIFNGNVFEWVWPAKPLPGTDMTNLPAGSGGEDFGGSLTQAKDGKVYIQAGKAGAWNVLLNGLEKTVVIPGGAITISDDDTRKALAMREQALQVSAGGRLAVREISVKFSGNFDRDFATCDRVSYQKTDEAAVKSALAYDDINLYAGWQVKDATPWINGAQDISQMYSCGDTVDLQLATDPKADPKRGGAAKGDLRVSIGNLNGKPTAVLYRFKSDEKKPRTFSSGVVQGWVVDYVDVISTAEIKVNLDPNKGYTVEVAIPLTALNLKPAPKLSLRGDVGVTHADPAGVRTRLRTYWSNQSTGLVDDIVFELQPTPANWGEFLFE